MVKDGELPALRVGGQWRFSEAAIDVWLKGRRDEMAVELPESSAVAGTADLKLTDLVPLQTLQTIQNQFSELLGVASFITDLDGQPLAPCSRCARFCRLVHTREDGMEACRSRGGPSVAMATMAWLCAPAMQVSSTPVRR